MSEQWFLRADGAGDRASLVAIDADGRLLHGPIELPLTEIAGRTGNQSVTVLLPASEIVSSTAALPATSASRLRQMLPFSLEDEFAGDVDDLQFAAGGRNVAGQLSVSVIARSRLDHWITRLREAGIEPKRILSEADGVADTPGVTTLLLDGPKLLGRRPGGAPFAFEELTLTELWHLLESESEDASDLAEVVLLADTASLERRRDEIAAWREGLGNLNLRELADGCLPKLAATLVGGTGPNFLQGDYAPRSDYLSLARPWRVAAGLVLGVLGLAVVGTVAEAVKLGRAEEALTGEIDALCSARYSTSREAACRLELQRRLAGAGLSGTGGGGFLPMLAAVAAAGGDDVQLEQLSYRDGVVTLEVVVPSIARLDAFDRQISGDEAFEAQVSSSSQQDEGRFRARVQVVSSNR